MSKEKKTAKKEMHIKLKQKSKKEFSLEGSPIVHEYGKGHICTTDGIGYATPGNRTPLEIVVDSSEGFIPLWDENVILRWKFDEDSLSILSNPDEIKVYVRELFAEALLKWGDAAPIRFSENSNSWDFKLRVEADNNCNPRGCTLARAFFPDPGINTLFLFPKMFEQNRKEQVDTVIHELGHVFGLRHFFANVREQEWPSEIFGEHRAFSIMNYGAMSELTDEDKNDLSLLYQLAWSGKLKEINGTRIRLITPFHVN
ncbi:MAG: matrixin family metalloprotease [Candidatus Thiodiazotropha taylori]|nr:matrixin family metalloprotease [Candidatus Thiodiazotropha taylori]